MKNLTANRPPLKGIIFDFDGTLVDSLVNATECFNEALLLCREAPRTAEEIKKHFGTGADRIFFQLLKDDQRAKTAFSAYKQRMRDRAHQIFLHEGVSDLLGQLQKAQIPLGIVTGRHQDDLEIVLEPHGIKDLFQVLIADNQVKNSKPHPEGLLLALEKMKLDPQEAMYVGDSTVDIQAAKAAGTLSVGALWDSLASLDALSLEQPDHLIQTPSEIWTLFNESR